MTRVVAVTVAAWLALLVGLGSAGPMALPVASAQASPTITTGTLPDLSQCVNSEPRPNCGHKPQSSGDPGGAGQLVLFGLLIFATVLFGVVIARSTIRVTRARNRQLT
jgi:hypothetical protein